MFIRTSLRAPALVFPFSAKKPSPAPVLQFKDKPSLMPSAQIQQQMPELYSQLQQEASALEAKAVRQHEWRIAELRKRLSEDSVRRVEKINEIVNGLTAEQKQYLQVSIVKSVENVHA